MTYLKTAIRDAVEKGGYKIPRYEVSEAIIPIEKLLLDPTFWASLGKARGWEGHHDIRAVLRTLTRYVMP